MFSFLIIIMSTASISFGGSGDKKFKFPRCNQYPFACASHILSLPESVRNEIVREKSNQCDNFLTDSCDVLGTYFYENRDHEKAYYFFKKSCSLESGYGCSALGAMYFNGEGVDVDMSMSKNLFLLGCLYGNGHGCYSAAINYSRERDVAINEDIEYNLYKISCLKYDHGVSCTNLGVKYEFYASENDYIDLYRRGCLNGDSDACFYLGIHFRDSLNMCMAIYSFKIGCYIDDLNEKSMNCVTIDEILTNEINCIGITSRLWLGFRIL